MKENTALLEIAIGAAAAAAKEILRVYDTVFDVSLKADQTPITLADRAAHDVILSHLKVTELPVLSEEGRTIPYEERKAWKRFWMVDPLDGTKEFVKRNGEFTVNIALIDQGESVAGAVLIPVSRTLYFGLKGYGAFKYDDFEGWDAGLRSLAKASEILPAVKKKERYVIIGSRSHQSPESKAFMEGLMREHPKNEVISMGSSIKMCLVAEGVADIYPRFAPTSEWDTAAAHAVVRSAGKDIIDQTTMKSMRYNKENLLNNWFITR